MQAKKVRNVQAAFKLFNSMMRRPGQGDITFLELQVPYLYPPLSCFDPINMRHYGVHALACCLQELRSNTIRFCLIFTSIKWMSSVHICCEF